MQESAGQVPLAAVSPAPPKERFGAVDALRGVAVLGILLVNQRLLTGPVWGQALKVEPQVGGIDRYAVWFIEFFAQGKFITLFATLFGLGLALQLDRRGQRDDGEISRWFARRLTILGGIGFIHAFGIWYGDVLLVYAILGFALLAVHLLRLSVKWCVILGVVAMTAALAFGILGTGLVVLLDATMPDQIAEQLEKTRSSYQQNYDNAMRIYPSGSWFEIAKVNARQWLEVAIFTIMFGPHLIGLFLCGFAIGRARIIQQFDRWRAHSTRWLMILLPIGVLLNVGLVLGNHYGDPLHPNLWSLATSIGIQLGALALAYSYAILLLRAWHGVGRRLLTPFTYVGRMALTNYLTHSLVFTTLCNGYGFGLYGRVSPAQGLGIAFLLFAVQIPFSIWWLQRFRFGPLEWAWRSLSYGSLQPMRRKEA